MADFFTRFGEEIAIGLIVAYLTRKKTVTGENGQWLYEGEAPFADQIRRAEDAHGLPRRLLAALLYRESRFRPDIISGETRSSVGALGIAQFMPNTAAEQLGSVAAALDTSRAIPGAAKYLAAIKRYLDARGGNGWRDAVIAYNWGMGNVAKWIADGRPFFGLPLESRVYVSEVWDELFT